VEDFQEATILKTALAAADTKLKQSEKRFDEEKETLVDEVQRLSLGLNQAMEHIIAAINLMALPDEQDHFVRLCMFDISSAFKHNKYTFAETRGGC